MDLHQPPLLVGPDHTAAPLRPVRHRLAHRRYPTPRVPAAPALRAAARQRAWDTRTGWHRLLTGEATTTSGSVPMTEAVIVATARSPIGRAFKGSLTTVRPDDLTCQMVTRRPGQGAPARPGRRRRPDPGLRPPRRRAGLQHGAGGRGHARARPPARHDGHPVLLVVAADHPDGLPRHQGRRGRRVHLGRRRSA